MSAIQFLLSRRRLLKVSLASAAASMLPAYAFNPGVPEVQSWRPYDNSIVIDGLSAAFDHGVAELNRQTLEIFRRSGVTAVNVTIPYPGDDFAKTNAKIDHTLAVIKKYPDYLRLINGVDDLLNAKKHKQIGIIIGFQSTEMFGKDLSLIDHFAKRGTRYMQMSYNEPSQFGSGGLVKADQGLTGLGKAALRRMEANNVLVDLSHSGKQTVIDAIAHAKKPITISHTGCNALYRHPRNNDDSELRAVAANGGVVGIYLMPFLEGGSHEIKAEAVINHIRHAVKVCGEDHVAIGSDQGIIPVNDTPQYREMIRQEVKRRIAAGISAPGETPQRPPFIPELNSERRMEVIAWHLKKAGFTDLRIEKILGKNLLNLYRVVW